MTLAVVVAAQPNTTAIPLVLLLRAVGVILDALLLVELVEYALLVAVAVEGTPKMVPAASMGRGVKVMSPSSRRIPNPPTHDADPEALDLSCWLPK